MKLMLITTEEIEIEQAIKAGIDRIFVDLELIGKYERQGHLNTHITSHSIEDVAKVKALIRHSNTELLVRVNPWNEKSASEIEHVISDGADIVMLPMFKTKREVEAFISVVGGRAKTSLLLETSEALARLDRILEVPGIDEIHVGLNDLHLGLNLKFMFELLSDGIVEYLSNKIRAKNITFGFGGIAKIGQGDVPAELVLSEHLRLGSEVVILSRQFRHSSDNEMTKTLVKDIQNVRQAIAHLKENKSEFEENKEAIQNRIRSMVGDI